jgi:bacterioferritin (cytochrome b1)
MIKKLPIYTYNYKNSTETVTGIMAQDLLEIQPQELDLVSNINATGKDDDYMSIKNDKLMFILMKAIQEQEEKINYLEQELNKIKNN